MCNPHSADRGSCSRRQEAGNDQADRDRYEIWRAKHVSAAPQVLANRQPPLVPGCGRRANMAGGEGLPAPLEQHANVQPRQGGQSKSARATKHQQNAAKQSAYMRAPCTHRNAFSNTTSQAGHAVQSKHCIGHGPTLPCEVLVSCRQRDFCAGSAHTSKCEHMAASVTSLPALMSSCSAAIKLQR